MKYILLAGNPEKESDFILDCMDLRHPENNPVFLIPETIQLYEYIDKLKVSNKVLLSLRICNNLTNLDAEFEKKGEKNAHIDTFEQFLKHIVPGEKCHLTLLGDLEGKADEATIKLVRSRLTEVMQQLVYLNLSLDQIEVRTENDIQVRKEVKAFLDRLGALKKLARQTKKDLNRAMPNILSQGAIGLAQGMDGSLRRIQDALEKAGNNELRIMAAAMKKVGKSVIVNSILEQSIAPTSQILPTPNNCIYHRASEYTLAYPNRKGSQVKHYGNNLANLTEDLEKLFMGAENGTVNLSGPQGDMEIGYVARSDNPLTTYTIYDTPGPNREGKGGQEEAECAYRAVKETDMMIFAINYANHISTDEISYLRRVLEEYEKLGKRYSLVIAVNRMDERYYAEEGKCTTALLDLIRFKLKRVEKLPVNNFMVIGTSALTYFNCLEAPRLSVCAGLDFETDLDNALEEGLFNAQEEEDKSREQKSSSAVTILNQLDHMMDHAKRFNGVPRNKQTLTYLKNESGMPNLLSYVTYVAEGNAKTEKIYSLMRSVDKEFCDIQNMFQLEQLRRTLAQRRDAREDAVRILKDFAETVQQIYTWTNGLLWDFLDTLPQGEKSGWLHHYLGSRNFSVRNQPIEIEKLKEFIIAQTEENMAQERFIEITTEEDMPRLLRKELDSAFGGSQHIKDIGGKARPIISEDECVECFKNAARAAIKPMENKLQKRYNELNDDGEKQGNDLSKFFTSLAEYKQQECKIAAQKCADALKHGADITFKLELPAFAAKIEAVPRGLPPFPIKRIQERLPQVIERNIFSADIMPNNKLNINNNGWLGRRLWDSLRVFLRDEINRVCYDEDYIINVVYHEQIKLDMETCFKKAGIGKCYRPQLDDMLKSRREYFDKLAQEVETERSAGKEYGMKVLNVVDHTEQDAQDIAQMEQEYQDMQSMDKCFFDFRQMWRKVRPAVKAQ